MNRLQSFAVYRSFAPTPAVLSTAGEAVRGAGRHSEEAGRAHRKAGGSPGRPVQRQRSRGRSAAAAAADGDGAGTAHTPASSLCLLQRSPSLPVPCMKVTSATSAPSEQQIGRCPVRHATLPPHLSVSAQAARDDLQMLHAGPPHSTAPRSAPHLPAKTLRLLRGVSPDQPVSPKGMSQ